MIVVFVLWGKLRTEAAILFVRSAKAQGYEVWCLCDETASDIPNVDVTIRKKAHTKYPMEFITDRLAELEVAEYVKMDCDQIITGDISGGFDTDCDVSVFWREMKLANKPAMPYNTGIVFIRSRDFVLDWAKQCRALPRQHREWYGDQIALRKVVEKGKYRVKVLTDPKWNFTPKFEGDRSPGTLVYHFKGQRKEWMRSYADDFEVMPL